MSAKNSRLKLNNGHEKQIEKKNSGQLRSVRNGHFIWNKLPAEQEAEPKPGSSLLWAQGPCDVVSVACREETSSVLAARTCGVRGEKEKRKRWKGWHDFQGKVVGDSVCKNAFSKVHFVDISAQVLVCQQCSLPVHAKSHYHQHVLCK